MSKENFPSNEQKIEKKKTREELFEELKKSLEKYGVEGLELRIEEEEGELKLILEQECGSGIVGLGYDGKLWLCLNQEREVDEKGESRTKNVVNEFAHNANTVASLESKFPGVNFVEEEKGMVKVEIDSDHPTIAMAEFLKDKEIQLRGGYSGWGNEDPFEFNDETGKWETRIKWNGNSAECKIMIRDTEYKEDKKVTKPMNVEWNGKYGKGAKQRMEIIL